jgi:fatty acid desaturase
VHLANDPGCICGCAFEDAIHYILECCLYNEAREELKLRLVFLDELKIEVLLFGDDTLTEMQNLQIFKSVQLYIKRTKRFNHFVLYFVFVFFCCVSFFFIFQRIYLQCCILYFTIADACTIIIIYYVERTLVNCYNLCPIQLL